MIGRVCSLDKFENKMCRLVNSSIPVRLKAGRKRIRTVRVIRSSTNFKITKVMNDGVQECRAKFYVE
jgi:hypothetical protein